MELILSKDFRKDFRSLPKQIQQKIEKALLLFQDNQRHPSLQVKAIQGTNKPKVYEGRIDLHYRFTFHYEDNAVILRRAGPHNIIDKEARA